MSQLKDLLLEEMQDLYHAEMQLTRAIPKMAAAAHNPKLREAFEKHLTQTQGHVERLKKAFELLGEQRKLNHAKRWQGWWQRAKRQSKKARRRKRSLRTWH